MRSNFSFSLFILASIFYNCLGIAFAWCQDVNEASFSKEQPCHFIKNFYKTYATNLYYGHDEQNDSLLKKNATNALREKIHRMAASTNSDPVIRAQDFNPKTIKTFEVHHLKDDWYMFSYQDENNQEERVGIPLRLTTINKKLLISYITPEWNKSLYGDNIITLDEKNPFKIENTNPEAFLKSFYYLYTTEYCIMREGLTSRLEILHKKYLTPKAYAKLKEADPQNLKYDLLIDDSDFDKVWQLTLKFNHITRGNFKVSYTKWDNLTSNIYVSIVNKEGAYFIDDIVVK